MISRPGFTRSRWSKLPLAMLASLLLACLIPSLASAAEANLTQFGPQEYTRGAGKPSPSTSTFRAAEAPARLIVSGDGRNDVTIVLNGKTVFGREDKGPGKGKGHDKGHGKGKHHGHHGFRHRRSGTDDGGSYSTRVDLQAQNTISVKLTGKPGSSVTVRVKQRVSADIDITGWWIYGLQVTDFEKQLAMYEKLGLNGIINPAGPETNTQEMAEVLGLTEPYRLKVALSWINTPGVGVAADTVQFLDPFRSDPPYAKLNHLGLTHVTYGTGNLDGAVAYLKANGVDFVSDPAGIPGSRFAFFRDEDGTYFKLVEDKSAPAQASPTALTVAKSIALNASDLDRTKEFLGLFGFTQAEPIRDEAAPFSSKALAWGLPGGFRNTGYELSNPKDPGGPTIELRRWKKPYDSEPAYPLPMNHLGIVRLIFTSNTANLVYANEQLEAAGIEAVGPPARCCNYPPPPVPAGGIGVWKGPDGITVETGGPIPFE